MSRSPKQEGKAHGRLLVRFETIKFCFTDDVLGIRLKSDSDKDYLVLLGILWSSFARYYLWFATSMWGTRNDKVHKGELLDLPVRFPERGSSLESEIIRIVQELRAKPVEQDPTLFYDTASSNMPERVARLEEALDQCIFDLFDLAESERDLVRDLCEYGLPLFYDGWQSTSAQPVVIPNDVLVRGYTAEIDDQAARLAPILNYVRVFAKQWNTAIDERKGKLAYSVVRSPDNTALLAVVFASRPRDQQLPIEIGRDTATWEQLLGSMGDSSVHPMAGDMYVDGLVRLVSRSNILIMKRNERRLWTRSLARVDAEATWLKAMKKQSIPA